MLNKRDFICDLALRWVGKPYLWGGDDPVAGFDCSGLMVELLTSVGKIPRGADLTAEGLRQRFLAVTQPARGCLVFWGDQQKGATHVELLLDEDLAIGASGGGSKTITLEEAIRTNAFIKVRPWRSREGGIGFRDPFLQGSP